MVSAVAIDLDRCLGGSLGPDAAHASLAIFLFTIVIPFALLVHTRFPQTTGRRLLFAWAWFFLLCHFTLLLWVHSISFTLDTN